MDRRVALHLFGQAAVGVHDGGMVAAAKGAADFGVAEVGELAGEVDDDVAGLHQGGAGEGPVRAAWVTVK